MRKPTRQALTEVRPVAAPRSPRSPDWWTDQHTTLWERVKSAFRRDWEETKADLKRPEKDVAKALELASDDAHRAIEDISEAKAGIAVEHAKLNAVVKEAKKDLAEHYQVAHAQIASAQDDAVDGIQKQQSKISDAITRREEAIAQWDQVEREARYGYGARSRHTSSHEWNEKLEVALKSEWDDLGTGRTWDESKWGVQRGWDYAKPADKKTS